MSWELCDSGSFGCSCWTFANWIHQFRQSPSHSVTFCTYWTMKQGWNAGYDCCLLWLGWFCWRPIYTCKNDHVGVCCMSIFPSLNWDCLWLDASWWLGTELLSGHHIFVWSSWPALTAWWVIWPHTVVILRIRCLLLAGALKGRDQNHHSLCVTGDSGVLAVRKDIWWR